MQGDGIRVVGVLETGRPPEDLAPAFGDYPGMIGDWLAAQGRALALIELRRGATISYDAAEEGLRYLAREANPEVLPDLIAAAFAA